MEKRIKQHVMGIGIKKGFVPGAWHCGSEQATKNIIGGVIKIQLMKQYEFECGTDYVRASPN